MKKELKLLLIMLIMGMVGIGLSSCKRGKKKAKTTVAKVGRKVSATARVSFEKLVVSPTHKYAWIIYKIGKDWFVERKPDGKKFGPFNGYAVLKSRGYVVMSKKVKKTQRRPTLIKIVPTVLFVEDKVIDIPTTPKDINVTKEGNFWFRYRDKEGYHLIINGKEFRPVVKSAISFAVSENGASWGCVGHEFLKKEWFAIVNGKEYLRHKSSIQPSNIAFSKDGSKWWWVIFKKGGLYLVENGKLSKISVKTKTLTSSLSKLNLYVSDNGNNKLLVISEGAVFMSKGELWVNGKSHGIWNDIEGVVTKDNIWGAVLVKRGRPKSKYYVTINGKLYGPYSFVDYKKFTVSEDGTLWGFVYKENKKNYVVINGREYGPFDRVGWIATGGSPVKWAFNYINYDKSTKTATFGLYVDGKEILKDSYNYKFSWLVSPGKVFITDEGRVGCVFKTEDNSIFYVDGKKVRPNGFRNEGYGVLMGKFICAYSTREGSIGFEEY